MAGLKRSYKPPSNRPSPSLHVLLAAEARELLTTWEVLRNKELIERHLSKMDKKYKPGAEKLIRAYMHAVKKHERSTE